MNTTSLVPLLPFSWNHPMLPPIDEREELSRYFRRGDAILNELRANYVDLAIEQEEATGGEQIRATPSSLTFACPAPQRSTTRVSPPRRRRRGPRTGSSRHSSSACSCGKGNKKTDNNCFSQTLSDLVQCLEELRVEGARNPFEEDSPLQQEISEATEQFLNTSTTSTALSGVPSCVVLVKPVALRATDVLTQRRTIL